MDPRDLDIKDFMYDLPAGRIANYPLQDRDQSGLLVLKIENEPVSAIFRNIADYLPKNSLLVLNDTRVIHARLLFRKPSGAGIEVFCLHPREPVREVQSAFTLRSPVVWDCLIGNARRWNTGVLELSKEIQGSQVRLRVERDGPAALLSSGPVEKANSYPVVFSWDPPGMPFSEIIEEFGLIPLPPYIHREAEESDNQRYQTIYARQEGSVAAPTAGLHFTPAVLQSIKKKGIQTLPLTLHVGAGTFRPVTSKKLGDHSMHAESFIITAAFLKSLHNALEKKIIAVGTTSVRTLESLYWLGCQVLDQRSQRFQAQVGQWEPYGPAALQAYSRESVVSALISYLETKEIDSLEGETRLLIGPGYTFRMVDGMITNFHQPGSTLLLLIAAFLGPAWKEAYQYALDHDFRFLSYGDSCLFLT